MAKKGYTDVQLNILRKLKDGEPHTRDELTKFLSEGSRNRKALSQQLARLRKKLNENNQTIVCVLRNYKVHYQWVRLLLPIEPQQS